MKKERKVKVYMMNINYLGEVTDTTLIAEFRNDRWAEDFVEKVVNPFVENLGDVRVKIEYC